MAPVSSVVDRLPTTVPQILINRELVRSDHFDVAMLGDIDSVVSYLCEQLTWSPLATEAPPAAPPLEEVQERCFLFAGGEAPRQHEPQCEPNESDGAEGAHAENITEGAYAENGTESEHAENGTESEL